LAAAAAERRPIPMLSAELPELSVADAYEVQAALVARQLERGDTRIGYKLGLVSRAKQEAMGVAAPLWGRLTDSMLLAEDVPLDTSALIHPRVEPEIAFLLGSDLPAVGASVATVLAATAAVLPALEVLDSRYEEFRFTLPDVIADNASAARIVLGGRSLDPAALDLQLEGMALRRDGTVVHTAAGAAIGGHPAAVVAWLAREVGGLEAGSVILSGGLTAPVELGPGTVVSAEFANLGTVTLGCGS
ncbi:MAG TPA: fumarylacetoacetate hydrolase family protein, partial [Solirubrobacterales bacterium]